MRMTVYAGFSAKCLRLGASGWYRIPDIQCKTAASTEKCTWLAFCQGCTTLQKGPGNKSRWSLSHLQGLTYSTQIALPALNPH